MRPIQKALMTVLWGLTVLIMVSVIGAGLWRKRHSEWPLEQQTPPFELVDQNGQPVTPQTLAGKPWIADFVFTQCAGPCPRMTGQMAELQKELTSKVQLVSFSVDPERDTPAVLKEYARAFKADEPRWRFLTGSKDAVLATARGMLISVQPADEKNPILHSTRFLLIDGEGIIRNTYESNDEKQMTALKHDAARLAKER